MILWNQKWLLRIVLTLAPTCDLKALVNRAQRSATLLAPSKIAIADAIVGERCDLSMLSLLKS